MFRAEFRSRVRNTRLFSHSGRSHSSHTRHRNSFFLPSPCSIFTWESSFDQLQQNFDFRNSLVETVPKCREIRRRMPTHTLGRHKVAHLRRATPVATQLSHPTEKLILASLRVHELAPLHLSMQRQAIEIAQVRIHAVLGAHILFKGVHIHRFGVAI